MWFDDYCENEIESETKETNDLNEMMDNDRETYEGNDDVDLSDLLSSELGTETDEDDLNNLLNETSFEDQEMEDISGDTIEGEVVDVNIPETNDVEEDSLEEFLIDEAGINEEKDIPEDRDLNKDIEIGQETDVKEEVDEVSSADTDEKIVDEVGYSITESEFNQYLDVASKEDLMNLKEAIRSGRITVEMDEDPDDQPKQLVLKRRRTR